MKHSLYLSVIASFIGFTAACGDHERVGTVPPGPAGLPTRPQASPPLDIATVMRSAALAFRADGGGFRAHGGAHHVRVERGVIRFSAAESSVAGGRAAEAPLALRTERVSRDGAPDCAQPLAEAADGGAVIIERCVGVREQIENTEGGVEQSWSFGHKPDGEGDLVIEVSARGKPFLMETEGGLHFTGGGPGAGIRYGQATWVDARGNRVSVRPQHLGDRIVMRVPADVVEHAAYPAVLDPVIGPELVVDEPLLLPGGSPNSAEISHGAGQYLLVWQSISIVGADRDLFAVRIKDDGTVLDPTGIPVCAYSNSAQSLPAVDFDGSQWLVVWGDDRNDQGDIYGARVGADGQVVDPNGIPLITQAGFQDGPGVDFDGANHMLVWREGGSPLGPVKAARFSPQLAPMDGQGVVLINGATATGSATVTHGNGQFLAAWPSNDVIYFSRVGADGTPKNSIPGSLSFSGSPTPVCSAVRSASDGQDFLLVFLVTSQSKPLPSMQRISAGGALIGTGVGIKPPTSGAALGPSLVFGGNAYFASWAVVDAVTGAGMDASVQPIPVTSGGGQVIQPISGLKATATTLGFDGKNLMLGAVVQSPPALADIEITRLSSTLAALDVPPVPVTHRASHERSPAVAWNGTSFLVVWENTRTIGKDIYGAMLDGLGQMISKESFVISQAANDEATPRVAAAGSDFLVVWQDARTGGKDIYGARVDAGGKVLDPGGIKIIATGASETRPQVASDGENFVVTWSQSNPVAADLRAIRVGKNGAVLDPQGILVAASSGAKPGGIVWGGSDYLVAWEGGGTFGTGIYGARLSKDGVPLDATPNFFAATPNNASPLAVASNGSGYLLAWHTPPTGNGATDIAGMLAGADGKPLSASPTKFVVGPSDQGSPALVSNGSEFWLAWKDASAPFLGGIYAARVGFDGVLKDASPFVISEGDTPAAAPALAAFGPGRELLVYERYAAEQPYNASQIRARRVVEPGAPGSACATDGECSGGSCVDGFCCDVACAGPCEACSSAKKGGGQDGACGPVADGTDPDSECAGDGLSCTVASCSAGACSTAQQANTCLIAGSCYSVGNVNPGDPCATCSPVVSATAWTPTPGCPSGPGGGAGQGGAGGAGPGGGGSAGGGASGQAGSQGGAQPAGGAGPGGGSGGEGATTQAGGAGGGGPGGAGGSASGTGGAGGGDGGSGGASPGAMGGGVSGGAGSVSASGSGGEPTGSGGAGGSGNQVCVPGQQIACACLGGDEGVQACSSDGKSFGSCTGCPSTMGPAPAGAGGGAGKSGSAGSGQGGTPAAAPPTEPAAENAPSDGACGCMAAGRKSGSVGAFSAVVLAFVLGGRRRRHRFSCSRRRSGGSSSTGPNDAQGCVPSA
jgi:hypothetical protein